MKTKFSQKLNCIETELLKYSMGIFLIGFLLFYCHEPKTISAMIFLKISLVLGCFFLIQKTTRMLLPHSDPYLYPLMTALLGIGLTMLFRLDVTIFTKQLIWVLLAFAIFFVLTMFHKRFSNIYEYKYFFGSIGVIFLVLPLLFGENIGGHRSWIVLGPISFQSSEFAKLFIIIFLSGYLQEYNQIAELEKNKLQLPFRFLAPLLFIGLSAIAMFVLQRDLGSALLFYGTTLLMVYLGSNRISYALGGSIFFVLGVFICYFLFSHVQTRFHIWYNPWIDPNGQSFQIVQSLFALSNGGILGSGLGLGNPHRIPEVHTDFIFSAIGEEMGFMGSFAIFFLYLCVIYRGFKIAQLLQDPYEALMAAGLTIAFSLQVFIIIAGVTKFLPLTGITMPFLSYGGSSLMANFISVAFLMILSERKTKHGE